MGQDLSISEWGKDVWVVVLDRGEKANALSEALVADIHSAIMELKKKQARVVIFRSSGKVFCSGFDFSKYQSESIGDLLHRFVSIELMLQDLRQAPFLSIAYIDGAAFGAGADIATACTWRIGTQSAKFRFPGFQFGLALGTRYLSRIVGMQKARDILLLNQSISAEQAVNTGLLTELLDADGFDDAQNRIVEKIERLDTETINRITTMTLENTNHEDLSDLVRSITYGNLHGRIQNYLDANKIDKKA